MVDISVAEPAILVRGVSKQYGNDLEVLNSLDMTVIKGTIYGLLGSSGSGKTTLLGAILGSREIQNGAISILGQPPGVVPVKSIGYMPQDMALVDEFTVKNVFQHQGWIFGMTSKQIEERHQFFEELLDLPPSNKLIENLSGGEQRRVSLAVVLIQDPELLILDEPTVGLDPVLRQNLWDYLIKITKEEKKTVVITTHYIEEAKQADMVGMLRRGKMLAEGEPHVLMNQFSCNSLENLFMLLSVKQEENPNISNQHPQTEFIPKFEESKILNQKRSRKSSLLKKICFMNAGHTKALLSKNFIRYVRHSGTLMISLIFPVIQISVIFLAIGRIPDDMKIGIVNQELGDYKNCEEYINDNKTVGGYLVGENGTCVYKALGCKFVKQIQNIIPNQIYFESTEEALKAVKEEKLHQVLFFPHNYSKALATINNKDFTIPKDFDFSKVIVYRDEMNYGLSPYVEKELYNSYLKFAGEVESDCRRNNRTVKSPIVFNDPIFGRADFTYRDYIAPGAVTVTILNIAVGLSLTTIISEKTGGVWERIIISGVTPAEILMSYIITLSYISAIQTAESYMLLYYAFGVQCKGNLYNALMLMYSQAIVGVSIGILLSVISKTEVEATYISLGIAFPFLILTGFFWPIQGMPWYIKYISYAWPSTIPIESLNNIVFRGWDIFNFHVYKGYLVSCGYTCLFTLLSVFAFKFEKK